MSPVYNDNFDALMHIKRQETSTGSNSNVATTPASTPAAPTTEVPSTTSAPPTTSTTPVSTSSATPTTSSSSSTVPSTTEVSTTSSTSATSSTIVTTSSTSSSTTSSTPVSTTSTSTTAVVTTPASSSSTTALATNTSQRTTLIVSGSSSFSVVRTTSNGQVYTVTAVVGGTESATAGASTKKSFFQNTGAVVGVFVVVGIIVTALLVLIATVFLRRRRANKFDKEVQEAAREAARAQAPIDDDDDYAGGTSYNTHASQPMSTERPGGYGGYGSTAASSWDPYGRAAGTGGFEMQHRRTSTGTAPGMAGFAAGDVFARNVGVEQTGYNSNQGYGQGYAQDGYNTGYGQGYGNNQAYQTGYNNNTSPPQNYALAQPQGQQAGRAPIQAQMMMPEAQRHSYNTVGAFRSSPSYGQAHPGEQVEYGNAAEANNAARGYNNQQQGGYAARQPEQDAYAPRQSEDPYGGYEAYDISSEPGPSMSQGHSSNPPAYSMGAAGTAGATGDRKGSGAHVRRPSGATRYSEEDDSDVDSPPRRVLKVANE